MPRSRDRHARGIRGPLASPSVWLPDPPRLGPAPRAEFFAQAVAQAVAEVDERCPDALRGIRVGITDVPRVTRATSEVPLAEAVEHQDLIPAQIVLYRRPLEHRAPTRNALLSLVKSVLIEQLAVLTGRSITELGGQEFDDDE